MKVRLLYKIGKNGKPEFDVIYYHDPGPMPPLIEPTIKTRPKTPEQEEREKKN